MSPSASERVFHGILSENELRPAPCPFQMLPNCHHILGPHVAWAVYVAIALLMHPVPFWAHIKAEIDRMHMSALQITDILNICLVLVYSWIAGVDRKRRRLVAGPAHFSDLAACRV